MDEFSTATDAGSAAGAAAGAAFFAGIGLFIFLFVFAFLLLMLVSQWKVFVKAGRPGWQGILPFVNTYVTTKIVKKELPGFWGIPILIVLLFNPVTSIITQLLLNIELAKAFGKSTGFGIGLTFFGFIFLPLLAFGSAQYQLDSGNNSDF